MFVDVFVVVVFFVYYTYYMYRSCWRYCLIRRACPVHVHLLLQQVIKIVTQQMSFQLYNDNESENSNWFCSGDFDFDLELHRLWTSNSPEIQNGRIWKYSLTPKRLEDV